METAVHKPGAAAEPSDLPLVLRLEPVLKLSEDRFFALCQLNRDLRIERNAAGEMLLMSPTGGDTGGSEAEITRQLANWAVADGSGKAYSSSTAFRLPNGAIHSPDASWLPHPRLAQFSPEQRRGFIPTCPDFVLELRSPSDRLQDLQDKMAEYLANGARLGWLLDPEHRRVYVYRPGAPVERLEHPETIAGDPVLPGFVLDLRPIW